MLVLQPTFPYGKLKAKLEGAPSQNIISTTILVEYCSYLAGYKHSGVTFLQMKTSFGKTNQIQITGSAPAASLWEQIYWD